MPAKPPVTVSSAPVKVPIKTTMIQIKEAIKQGRSAVSKSAKAVKANPKDKGLIATHRKNEHLLSTAEVILKGLEASEAVANLMCPQQTANLMFDYE
ncbi:MAG: hypothetical protein ABI665_05050 [Vicinamibacterales bacterium]